MLYICTKFREIISNGIKVKERARFLYEKLQRGIILQKSKKNDHFFISACCVVMLYISTKFCEIILNGITFIKRTLFLYGKFQTE